MSQQQQQHLMQPPGPRQQQIQTLHRQQIAHHPHMGPRVQRSECLAPHQIRQQFMHQQQNILRHRSPPPVQQVIF